LTCGCQASLTTRRRRRRGFEEWALGRIDDAIMSMMISLDVSDVSLVTRVF